MHYIITGLLFGGVILLLGLVALSPIILLLAPWILSLSSWELLVFLMALVTTSFLVGWMIVAWLPQRLKRRRP